MTTPVPNPPQQPNRPNWFMRHKILTSIGVLVLLGVIFGGGSGGSDATTATSSTTATSAADSTSDTGTTEDAVAPAAKPAKKKVEQPAMTAGQENALHSAQDYLDMTSFSRNGLIQQLSSPAGDGYSRADATFAVNHLDVDWDEQAVKAAKDYLDMTSFSRNGLIQQLSSNAGDGYTHAQAVYAVNHVGL